MNAWSIVLSGYPLTALPLLALLVLALLVLLHEPANRRAVRLLRAWKRPGGK
jgi:hypothetical protein